MTQRNAIYKQIPENDFDAKIVGWSNDQIRFYMTQVNKDFLNYIEKITTEFPVKVTCKILKTVLHPKTLLFRLTSIRCRQ